MRGTPAAVVLSAAVASTYCRGPWASSSFLLVAPHCHSRSRSLSLSRSFGGGVLRIRRQQQPSQQPSPPLSRFESGGNGHRRWGQSRVLSFLGSLGSSPPSAAWDGEEEVDDDAPTAEGKGANTNALPNGANPNADSSAVVDAAAALTTSRSTLLGTKSVGVDYGTVRTGLAVTIGYDPKPITILSDLNNTQLGTEIVKLVESEGATQIVVGLPLHKNGTESERSGLTREFASELSCMCHSTLGPTFPVYLWDERYTSKVAAARIRSSTKRRLGDDDLAGTIDADAACIILEHYYASNGIDAERVQVPEHMLESCIAAWTMQLAEKERAAEAVLVQREESLNARQVAMERARAMEAKLAESGTLGVSRKKGKKNKKKKKKKKGGGGEGGGGKNWIIM